MSNDAATTAMPQPVESPQPEAPAHGLGASLPAADTRAKSEGTFPYASDLWAEGLLWAALLRSPHPHARIVSVDTSAAVEMPGVHAVITHQDIPGDGAYGRRIADRPVFASEIVRHHGEAIAAVAADHPDTARLAAAAIAVEYEVLEPVTDPEKAFAAEPLHPDGNLIRHIPLRYGDPEATGEVIVEGLYRIGRQDPAPIGAEAGLAVPRPDGGVELYVASTDPHTDRDLAAACFGLEPERVKVVVTGVPGATGDREDPGFQLPLGLLALRTGCPVKLAATREESFLGHAHRHPTLLRYRHHADAEGHLVKVEAQLLLDAGAYADASSESLAAAVAFACGPYVVPHAHIEGWAVRTNNPPSGHVRGEGAMQVCAAYEAQMDKLAAKLGLDQTEIRLRNVLATGDILPTGQTVTCPAPVAELLEAVRDFPLPALPKDSPEDDWLLPGGPEGAGEPGAVRRGVGYALGMVHMLGAEGTDEVSTATVKVHDGVATVICAAVETGSGFSTLARQIVQETLGVEDVRVASVDTDQPPAGPAAHGRHTWVSGGAVERAAKMVRTQLLQPLAHKFGMSTELLQITDGKITSYDGVLSTTVTEGDGRQGTLGPPPSAAPHPTEPLDGSGPGRRLRGPGVLRDPRGGGRRHRAGLGPRGGDGGGAGRGPRPQPRATGHAYRGGRHPGSRSGPHGEPPHGPRSDPPPRPHRVRPPHRPGRAGHSHRETRRGTRRGGPLRRQAGERRPSGHLSGRGRLRGPRGHRPPDQPPADQAPGGGGCSKPVTYQVCC
ncbi:dehydrogenase [Streptomyces pristinaespiralis ATCC 25486]|uniref:Dehydrogenase n=1 Tax=Streptomyces pristinaespiralis (strain ATCC 25486 / DSM 40338 / CBS 914.69 / JCM 4507 / KCC S-0507 / NBRC 13074 / NRRL 2958 / 5647) TaxID=457429 RepID=B5HDD2_STRE2|nr:dehydrogenase [Streptomyces pristinaespiralis ATCC 25486]